MTVLLKNANGYVSIHPVDPMPAAIAALRSGGEPVWVFAYGSLMWNPEIAFAEARPGFLHGYHRSFCLYSRDYRGTPERPGLVLGLDRGGSCRGIVYRLPPDRVGETLDRIWAREMTGQVYRMRRVAVRTPQGAVAAHACIVRRASPDYAGRLSLDEVGAGAGQRGRRARLGPRLSRQHGAPSGRARHSRWIAASDRRAGCWPSSS